jgi:uncharacterized membrane protein (DUF373 family)
VDSSSRSATRRRLSHRLEQRVIPALEGADALVYSLVGLVFFAAAAGMLGYSVVAFPGNLGVQGFPIAIITLINDLLLVMIIMEVLRTVLSYLEERGTSLRPFLFIATISATRRILAIGAQMSIAGETLPADQFQRAMVDLGANAAVILAIALALFLLHRHGIPTPEAPPTPRA